jgi:hypothetical protein
MNGIQCIVRLGVGAIMIWMTLLRNTEIKVAIEKYKDQTIAAGFWVALTLREGTAPLRSYVGEVQAVDGNGIRLTLIDWISLTMSGSDLFVPWSNIEAALIATPEHNPEMFVEQAKAWQNSVSSKTSGK